MDTAVVEAAQKGFVVDFADGGCTITGNGTGKVALLQWIQQRLEEGWDHSGIASLLTAGKVKVN